MKVRAKAVGQYKGCMVYPGDVFEIDTRSHLSPWMDEIIEELKIAEPAITVSAVEEIETPKVPERKPKFKFHFKIPYFELIIGGDHES